MRRTFNIVTSFFRIWDERENMKVSKIPFCQSWERTFYERGGKLFLTCHDKKANTSKKRDWTIKRIKEGEIQSLSEASLEYSCYCGVAHKQLKRFSILEALISLSVSAAFILSLNIQESLWLANNQDRLNEPKSKWQTWGTRQHLFPTFLNTHLCWKAQIQNTWQPYIL